MDERATDGLCEHARSLCAGAARFPGPPPTSEEGNHRLRVVALLRALTLDEAATLLHDHRLPERLATLADNAGLPVEECERVLAGGVRPRPNPGILGV